MKQLLILICLCILHSASFSQGNQAKSGRNQQNQRTQGGSIKGKLVDQGTKKPIEFANIIIYNADSSFSKGGVSGINGEFLFSKLPPNEYCMQIFYVGYEKKEIENLTISKKNPILDLQLVKLNSGSLKLDEVEIRASSATVEYKLDKKIINPANSISAIGGNATDILKNAPSVDVDIEGNVSLRGSADFHVLINGRPTILTGSDALKQIPSNAIKNIEIITNPSVKYAPDGTSGIINIITKQNKLEGFSGKVSTNLKTTGGYNGNLNLSYKTGKFNFFVSGNFSQNKNKEYEKGYVQSPFQNSVRKTIFDANSKDDFLHSSFEGGIEYELNENNALTLSIKNNIFAPAEIGISNKEEIRNERSYLYQEHTNEDMSHRSWASSLSWFHIFNNNKKHNLQTVVYLRKHNGDIDNNSFYTGDFEDLGYLDMVVKDDVFTDYIEGKMDYTRPLGKKSEIEAGLQSKISFSNADYQSTKGNQITAYEYDFKRNIHSAYASFSNSNALVDMKIGLRAEITDREINILNSPDNYPYNKLDFYPSVHLSKQLPHDFQLQASYSKRVNRPRSWRLNPFPIFSNELSARTGNPGLKPEYVNSIELGIQKRLKRNYIAFETFYRLSENAFSREFYFVGDIQYSRPTNLDTRETLGAEISANVEPFKWWSINGSVSAYSYTIKGMLDGKTLSQQNNSWQARVTSTFKAFKNTFVELRTMYRGKKTGLQSRRDPSFTANLALKQFFLNKKLTASISVRDVLGTAQRTRHSYINGLESKYEFTREQPIISFGISYLFNNFKKTRTFQGTESSGGGFDE